MKTRPMLCMSINDVAVYFLEEYLFSDACALLFPLQIRHGPPQLLLWEERGILFVELEAEKKRGSVRPRHDDVDVNKDMLLFFCESLFCHSRTEKKST